MTEKAFEELTYADYGTPRFQRARHTANSVLGLLRDFLPTDRDTLRRIDEMLVRASWETRIVLMPVRPEWDALNDAEVQAAMLETHPAMLRVKSPLTSGSSK